MMDANFYYAFEEQHRGSRELIKNRLRVYLPFILPLKQIYDDCSALDLGCGRGEWLELASEAGFKAHGVDVNDRMLKVCYERGLAVSKQDAIDMLKTLTDESQVVVSAFHLVEHISFDALQTLVKEALRVLKPAGLLILETPNPENIMVSTTKFYLDPTHQRPIPPQLLSFLPEHYGFSRIKILRLQEPSGLTEKKYLTLLDIIGGVSPDCAVVAQKNADREKLVLFDEAFKKDYGLTMGSLAVRYEVDELRTQAAMQTETFAKAVAVWEGAHAALSHDLAESERERAQLLAVQEELERELNAQLESSRQEVQRLNESLAAGEREKAQLLAGQAELERELNAQLESGRQEVQRLNEALAEGEREKAAAESRAQAAEAQAQQAEVTLEALRQELHAVHQANHHHWQQWEATKQELHAVHQSNHYHWQLAEAHQQTIQAIYSSRSWRITAPLRFINRSARWFVSGAWAWLTLKPGSRPRRIAKKIIWRGATAIEARPGLKQRIVAGADRLGLYLALRRLYHRIASQSMSIQTETPASHAPGHAAPPPGSDTNRPPSLPVFDGVSARQRTPLEAHFHAYGGRE